MKMKNEIDNTQNNIQTMANNDFNNMKIITMALQVLRNGLGSLCFSLPFWFQSCFKLQTKLKERHVQPQARPTRAPVQPATRPAGRPTTGPGLAISAAAASRGACSAKRLVVIWKGGNRPLSQVGSRRKRCPGQFGQDGTGLIPATPSTKHDSCFPPSSMPASIEISIKANCLSGKGGGKEG
jgi:hypothetical protein